MTLGTKHPLAKTQFVFGSISTGVIKASELQEVFSTCAVLLSLLKVQLWFCSSFRVGTETAAGRRLTGAAHMLGDQELHPVTTPSLWLQREQHTHTLKLHLSDECLLYLCAATSA